MNRIYLVRHGESIANTEGKYQGISYDTDLSELGHQQAAALGECFRDVFIGQIISSPLKRTMQTARAVGLIKHIPVQSERQIIETNHGAWESLLKNEIQKKWSKLYKKWLKFPSSVTFPNGEHFLETQKRVVYWWNQFVNQIDVDTLIVSHDNIIRIIIAKVLNMKLNRIWKFSLQPTAVSMVEIVKQKPRLKTISDSVHLGDLHVDLNKHAL